MKKQNDYVKAPQDIREAIDASIAIDDFLPPPELLIPKEETKKITIALSKKSLEFFKQISQKTHTPYQQMIRKVLDTYTDHYVK